MFYNIDLWQECIRCAVCFCLKVGLSSLNGISQAAPKEDSHSVPQRFTSVLGKIRSQTVSDSVYSLFSSWLCTYWMLKVRPQSQTQEGFWSSFGYSCIPWCFFHLFSRFDAKNQGFFCEGELGRGVAGPSGRRAWRAAARWDRRGHDFWSDLWESKESWNHGMTWDDVVFKVK